MAKVCAKDICFYNTDAKVDSKSSFVSKSHLLTSFRIKVHTVMRAARPQTHFRFHSKESHLGALLSLPRQLKQPRLPRCSWSGFRGPHSTSLSKHYPTFPPPRRGSLSRNFQRLLEASNWELDGEAKHGARWEEVGPSQYWAPSLPYSVIVLTEVESWRGGGSRGVKPCLLCLGVLESRSRLDLIFTPSSFLLP